MGKRIGIVIDVQLFFRKQRILYCTNQWGLTRHDPLIFHGDRVYITLSFYSCFASVQNSNSNNKRVYFKVYARFFCQWSRLLCFHNSHVSFGVLSASNRTWYFVIIKCRKNSWEVIWKSSRMIHRTQPYITPGSNTMHDTKMQQKKKTKQKTSHTHHTLIFLYR